MSVGEARAGTRLVPGAGRGGGGTSGYERAGKGTIWWEKDLLFDKTLSNSQFLWVSTTFHLPRS